MMFQQQQQQRNPLEVIDTNKHCKQGGLVLEPLKSNANNRTPPIMSPYDAKDKYSRLSIGSHDSIFSSLNSMLPLSPCYPSHNNENCGNSWADILTEANIKGLDVREKFDIAQDHISKLETENIALKNQITSLKFSLAQAESELVDTGEGEAMDDFEWENTAKSQSVEKCVTSPVASTPISTDSPKLKLQIDKKTDTRLDMSMFSLYKYPGVNEQGRWKRAREDLLTSSSFLVAGTGSSILDSLSDETRRDVCIRYCDILSTFNKNTI